MILTAVLCDINSTFCCYFALLDKTSAPVANAGGDVVVQLPVVSVALDGSASYDDEAIVSYLWERDNDSLAAGVSILLLSVDHESPTV